MKKIIKSIMLLPILAGCTININFQLAVPSEVVSNINNINNNNSTNNPAPTAEKYSVGLGYHAEWGGTVGTAAKFDLTTAFAAFDAEGKVYDVRFDVVQVKVTANDTKDGIKLTNTNIVDGSVTTNLELGSAHGMNDDVSNIDKTMNTQIESFADYCAGKTVAEVIASTTGAGHGIAVAPELEGKVTIAVDDFEAALQYAYDHKTTATYELSGTAGVAMISYLANGFYSEINVEFAGAFVKDGKVEVALLDTVVYPLTVSAEGAIDPNASSYYFNNGDTSKLRSKKDLGDEYSMAHRNGGYDENCVLEWYEQAAIIEKACIGKTSSEISALMHNEGDLASVSITTYSYIKALAKAADYAGRTVINPN